MTVGTPAIPNRPQASTDDLLRVPSGAAVVIVDAAKGIRPGWIIELPLNGLLSRDDRLRTRSFTRWPFRRSLRSRT